MDDKALTVKRLSKGNMPTLKTPRHRVMVATVSGLIDRPTAVLVNHVRPSHRDSQEVSIPALQEASGLDPVAVHLIPRVQPRAPVPAVAA